VVIAVAEDDVSGFIVDTIEEAVQGVQKIASPNRATVRPQFERRFTVERMAHDYLEIYRRAAVSRMDRARTDRMNGTHLSLTMAAPADAGDHLTFSAPSG